MTNQVIGQTWLTLTKRASTSTKSKGIIHREPVSEMKSPKNGSKQATKVEMMV